MELTQLLVALSTILVNSLVGELESAWLLLNIIV